MKKFLCFVCIFCIMVTIIPINANAEIIIDDVIEMYIQWFIDTGSEMLGMTPDELIDFCNTAEGYQWLQTVWNASGGIMGNVYFNPAGNAKTAVKDTNNARYLSYKIKKNLLQNLANNYNGYCSETNRNLLYSNYMVKSGYNLRTDFGHIDGQAPYVGNGADSTVISVWFHPTAFYSNTVQVFKGSHLSPPVIYVPSNGALMFRGISLTAGYYIPVSDSELFYLGNDDKTYKSGWRFEQNPTYGTYTLYYLRHYYNYNVKFLDTGVSSSYQTWNTGKYTYEYLYDKIVKSVGLYLPMNNEPWVELPPDSDFDSDDDTITMLLPIDEPSPPIYIPNSTYDEYITNNLYTYDNDTTNNYVTNNDIQNIYNILYDNSDTDNNTTGSYDDTNFRQMVSNKLNEIINLIKNIKELLTERKQAEENVGTNDTPYTIPALGKISNLFNSLQSAITDDNLTPPVLKIRIMDYEKNLDFSWFSTDTTIYWVIRRLLETSIYIQGLLYILSLIKSFVGLNSSQ